MPRPKDIADKATRESRSRGGQARAEKIRAEKEEERRLLAELRRGALDEAVERLARAAEKAADAITRLLDGATSETVQLRAGIAVLELLDAAELRELSDRLAKLEELASSRNGSR
jgi:hypothetical protein